MKVAVVYKCNVNLTNHLLACREKAANIKYGRVPIPFKIVPKFEENVTVE